MVWLLWIIIFYYFCLISFYIPIIFTSIFNNCVCICNTNISSLICQFYSFFQPIEHWVCVLFPSNVLLTLWGNLSPLPGLLIHSPKDCKVGIEAMIILRILVNDSYLATFHFSFRKYISQLQKGTGIQAEHLPPMCDVLGSMSNIIPSPQSQALFFVPGVPSHHCVLPNANHDMLPHLPI